jgi:predicted permease
MKRPRGFGERLLRLAMWSHPQAFRREYRDEMLAYYRQACAESSGRLSRVRFFMKSLRAALSEGAQQRRAARARLNQISSPRRPPMTGLVTDIRQAWRRVAARPFLSALAVGMLALAISVTTAMFTVVDALMLRPAPFPDPERLVRVVVDTSDGTDVSVSLEVFAELERSRAFERVTAAMGRVPVVLDDGPEPVQVSSAIVSPGFFEVAGVRPVLGRTFVPGDGRPGTTDRTLISEALWRDVFGRDPGILGRRISLAGVPTEIVGVMPLDFHLPNATTKLWRPADPAVAPLDTWVHVGTPAIARLASDVPRSDALRLATDAIRRAPAVHVDAVAGFRPVAERPLDEYSRNAVTRLAGGVALVFLVLCANVATLLLARAAESRRHYAVSSALGASRKRLLRQAALESATLGMIGVVVGLAAGWVLVSLARQFLPEAFLLQTLNPLDLDQRAVFVTAVLGLVATLLAGLAPAWLGTSVSAVESVRSAGAGTRGGTAPRAQRLLTRGLLAGEIALAVTLLFGATLLVRSFVNLVGAERGLDSDRVVAVRTWLPRHTFEGSAARRAFASALETELRGRPGVESVALSYGMPPGGSLIYRGEVRTTRESGGLGSEDLLRPVVFDGVVDGYPVGPGFFRVYGIQVLEGRTFRDEDPEINVVVGETLANLLAPGRSAVGRTFTIGSRGPLRVIGVVNEVRSPELDPRDDSPELYQPLFVGTGSARQALWFSSGTVDIGLRCAAACPPLADVRQWVRQASPYAIITALHQLDDEYLELMSRPRAAAALSLAFAVVALLVAAGGVYSVQSYAVARRRREFGIRVALGAAPRQLRRLVYGDGLIVAAIGLGVGGAGAWALSRSLSALAYGITPGSPSLWLVVTGTLAAAMLAAMWKPAREAARSDPALLMHEQ